MKNPLVAKSRLGNVKKVMQQPSFSVRKVGDKIVVKTNGPQQMEAVEAILEKIIKITHYNSEPLDILVIASGVGVPHTSVMQAALQGLLDVSFHHLAIVGETPDRLESAQVVARGGNDRERIKVFRHEEDARAWLDESHSSANTSKNPKNKL